MKLEKYLRWSIENFVSGQSDGFAKVVSGTAKPALLIEGDYPCGNCIEIIREGIRRTVYHETFAMTPSRETAEEL